MRVAIIAPVTHLMLSVKGDIGFCLAHELVAHPETKKFWRKAHTWTDLVIMDNGAFEHGIPLDIEELVKIAKGTDVNEIVLPDIPDKPLESYLLSKSALETLSSKMVRKYRWMYVPHGRSLPDYVKNYENAKHLYDITGPNLTIGLSILDLWKWNLIGLKRHLVVAYLIKKGKFMYHIHHHLLGLDCPAELTAYKGSIIRSVDTSLPISLAVSGKLLGPEEKFHYRAPRRLPSINYYLVNTNIRKLLNMAHQVI